MDTVESLRSPKAPCAWACTAKPNAGGNFESKFGVTLILSPKNSKEHKSFLVELKAQFEATGGKNPPYKVHLDENKQKTDRWEVKFQNVNKAIEVIDSAMNPIHHVDNFIGNGSIVIIGYIAKGYDKFGGGLSLYVDIIQLIELIKYEKHTLKDYGFKKEKGFTASDNDFSDKKEKEEAGKDSALDVFEGIDNEGKKNQDDEDEDIAF